MANGLALVQEAVGGLLCTLAAPGAGAAAVGAALGFVAGMAVPAVEVGVGGVAAGVTGIFDSFIYCVIKLWLWFK